MDIYIPGYIKKTLLKLQHSSPKNPEVSPFKAYPKQYGAKVIFVKEEDGTPELSEDSLKLLQKNIGSILFYGRALEMKFLVALSNLTSAQTHGIEATAISMVRLLNYCDIHPDAFIRYKQSNMILAIQIDASYLSNPKVRNQELEIFFLTYKP